MRRGPRNLRHGLIIAAVLLSILALSGDTPAVAGMRGKMLHLINHARQSRGEHEVKLNLKVSKNAERHSRAMANCHCLFHTGSVPSILGSRPWSVWGENVAQARTVGSTFRRWMHSPEHRANILNRRFRHVGIGIVPKGGWLWSTTDFWG